MFSSGEQSLFRVIRHSLLRGFAYDEFSRSMSAKFDGEQQGVISGLFDRMLSKYTGRRPGYEDLIRSWTVELLVYVFRGLCDNQKDTAVKEPSQLESDMFQRVFEYIRQNYTENISLERLVMLAFVSPKYFSRLFKNHTGITVTEYIQRLRVNRACELLTETACPVTEIAAQAGYSDLKYFNKVFRRLIGMTPAEYRRNKT